MITIWILFVFTHVNSGSVITTQEFNSRQQCEYVAQHLKTTSYNVEGAWCVQK